MGHEQQGARPVLVVSIDIFNRITNTAVIAPITSDGGFARRNGYAVSLAAAGIKTTGIVRCDQLRTMDILARGGKRLEAAPDAIMAEVLARIATLFQ
jgi:mRNA-degrading endonuclease toxin of MazEF toxin-antitoxin module